MVTQLGLIDGKYTLSVTLMLSSLRVILSEWKEKGMLEINYARFILKCLPYM